MVFPAGAFFFRVNQLLGRCFRGVEENFRSHRPQRFHCSPATKTLRVHTAPPPNQETFASAGTELPHLASCRLKKTQRNVSKTFGWWRERLNVWWLLKNSDEELFPAQHAGAKYQDHIIYFECATATFWKEQHLKVYITVIFQMKVKVVNFSYHNCSTDTGGGGGGEIEALVP